MATPRSLLYPPLPCRHAAVGMRSEPFGLRPRLLTDVVAAVPNERPGHSLAHKDGALVGRGPEGFLEVLVHSATHICRSHPPALIGTFLAVADPPHGCKQPASSTTG
jgi:hypothetical protein